jgi:hypothetical protein
MSEGKYLIYEIAILNECGNFITAKSQMEANLTWSMKAPLSAAI